jgi:Ni,Fe-hydrogenase maturation factor
MKILFLAYGNIDRQDDGVGWHLLCEVMRRLNCPPPEGPDDEMPKNYSEFTFDYHLQLTPELAESLGEYGKICFMDAHTGNVPEEINIEKLTPRYQTSPFTHHMTAATLLSLSEVINHRAPESILVSVRGYEFLFTRSLSTSTASLIPLAADKIVEWVHMK